MSNTVLPQQSVSTSLNPDRSKTATIIGGDNSLVAHRNDSSLSPISKVRDLPKIPRSKSAVAFGTAATAPSQPSISTPTAAPALPVISNRSKQRPFRSILNNDKTSGITRQWVTREIAALEFLQMGIPMAREGAIVHEGWTRQNQTSDHYQERANKDVNMKEESERKNEENDDEIFPISPALLPLHRPQNSPDPTVARQGRWWEKWITGQNTSGPNHLQQEEQSKGVSVPRDSQIEDLEEPDLPQQQQQSQSQTPQPNLQDQTQQPTIPSSATATIYAPGRRLEGDPATKVQIPLANTLQNIQGGPRLGVGSSHQTPNSDVVSLQLTKHQSIARMAISREWELRVAHGLSERRHHQQQQDQSSQPNRQQNHNPAMLDGRMYMSAKESYPMMVFSLIRYEPKKEEALRRRQKLEERGGGGTQFFIMPSRDWRGISFRSLLPVTKHKTDASQTTSSHDGSTADRDESVSIIEKERGANTYNSRLLFDRFAAKKTESKDNFTDDDAKEDGEGIKFSGKDTNDDHDDMDMDLDSDDEEEMGDDTYVAGLLDDPGMVQGRHRNVMIGDRGTGPIVSSTIQFVKPKLLKADLNQQFRERFDGYEPPISQRKFIGAKVVDGIYTLMDPTKDKGIDDDESRKIEDDNDTATEATTIATVGTPTTGITSNNSRNHRKRVGSTSSMSLSTSASIDGGTAEGKETIRMPPSLTLSKIRSLKQQALAAAVRAKLEISTVALAITYFERLCLDCRVDKSNRRLSFAACLLLAIKINEAHVGVITTKAVSNSSSSKKSRASQKIQSLIRPSKKSSTMFASLLEFFTQEWNISLKHLFAAEWGVFAALQFRLKAKPSDVAFHFRRLMKTLGYDPRRYLGSQVYGNWQQALAEEEFRRQEWEARVQAKRERQEKKKLKQLQREIDEAADRQGDRLIDDESVGEKSNELVKVNTNNTMEDQSEIEPQSQMNTLTRRRLGLGDIFKTRIAAGNTGGGAQRRSVSIERSWTKRRSSGDVLSSTIKNAPVSTLAVARHRAGRPPLLRPLSQSKSMLSLSAKGSIDEKLERKNSEIHLDDLDEESGVAQHADMELDEEEGIVI